MGQQQSQSKDELLFQEVSYNNVQGIKSLSHEGAGLEWVDKEGRTPLILACTYANLYDVAETLLELGSNVNAYRSGYNGGTPLHHAAKSGLENTVKLLLSHGANPLVLNDDFKTPLDIARAKGYSNVVRAIESHICLFSGWMREFYGPSFLELVAPQLLSRRVWVVIVPTGSRDPTKPLKLELVVYASLQDAQPRTRIALSKANLEEPESNQSDASVMIVDNSTSPRRKREIRRTSVSQARRWVQVEKKLSLKLAAAMNGDMKQMNWFCDACKGIPQPMNPPMFLQTSQPRTISAPLQSAMNEMPMLNHHAFMANVDSISQELTLSVPPLRDGNLTPVDISLPSGNCENKEDGVCVICVDASSEAVCVPCGHVAGCVSCLKEIKDKKLGCPICRANIDQVIKLYHV